jgi:Sec-independent protein translocase protein TatA
MTFFGIGGFEFLVIGAIALFVLGPRRLLGGIREGRRIYSDLKRQREVLQSMLTQAIDLDDLKSQADVDSLSQDAKALKEQLALDQISEGETSVEDRVIGSVSRTRQLRGPPVKDDLDAVGETITNSDINEGGELAARDSQTIDNHESKVKP